MELAEAIRHKDDRLSAEAKAGVTLVLDATTSFEHGAVETLEVFDARHARALGNVGFAEVWVVALMRTDRLLPGPPDMEALAAAAQRIVAADKAAHGPAPAA
jgi:hypothetical protein